MSRNTTTDRAWARIETSCNTITRAIVLAGSEFADSAQSEAIAARALVRAVEVMVQSVSERLQGLALVGAQTGRPSGAPPVEAAELSSDARHVCKLIDLASVEIGVIEGMDDADAALMAVLAVAERWADDIAHAVGLYAGTGGKSADAMKSAQGEFI